MGMLEEVGGLLANKPVGFTEAVALLARIMAGAHGFTLQVGFEIVFPD
jgi:hypothetical protein